MNLNSVLQDILQSLIQFCIQSEKPPQKIFVSEKIMEMLKSITLMPRSVQYINSVFYIADIPVEQDNTQYKNADIWYRIV